MSGSDSGLRALLSRLVALVAGAELLLLARAAERAFGPGLLAAVLLEEGLKGTLFLGLLLARRWLARLPAADLLPLLGITGFALAENILYFLAGPTSSIYQRILIAYPVHFNTGLLYTLALLRGGLLPALLGAVLGCSYHLAYNLLVYSGTAAAAWAAGAANLLVLFVLSRRLARLRLERSLDACWNSG